MKKGKVSVVIPTYNQAEFIGETLYSLAEQTQRPDEVIIVNDASPDNTNEVLKELARRLKGKLSWTLIQNKTNLKLAKSRNKGIDRAKGPYIVCLDSDDKLEPEYIEKCAAVLDKKNKVDVVYTNYLNFGELDTEFVAPKTFDKDLHLYHNFTHCASMFRKRMWKLVGGFKEFYAQETQVKDNKKEVKKVGGYEDWEFWLSIHEAGGRFQKVEGVRLLYRRRKESMVTGSFKHDAELRFQIRQLHPKLYKKTQILFVPEDDGAKGHYRLRQFAKTLAGKEVIDEATLEYQKVGNHKGLDIDHFLLWAEYADALWIQEPMAFELLPLMRSAKKFGRKVILEFDDDPFRVNPSNPAYVCYGTKEMNIMRSDGTSVPIWVDGKDGFVIEHNKKRLEMVAVMVQNADLVVVTTDELKQAFTELDPNVYVLPNYVDMKRWSVPIQTESHPNEIRIVWQGGSSHMEDFLAVRDVLPELLRKYPQVKMYFYGQGYEPFLKILPKKQVVIDKDWVHFEAHAYRMLMSGADIAIAPLADNVFNRRKSCIKWVEFGAMGVPMVAQDMPPYSPVIKDGKTGFLAKGKDEWFKKLEQLVKSEILRHEIGKAVKQEVEQSWTVDNYDKHWGEIRKLLYDEKNIR